MDKMLILLSTSYKRELNETSSRVKEFSKNLFRSPKFLVEVFLASLNFARTYRTSLVLSDFVFFYYQFTDKQLAVTRREKETALLSRRLSGDFVVGVRGNRREQLAKRAVREEPSGMQTDAWTPWSRIDASMNNTLENNCQPQEVIVRAWISHSTIARKKKTYRN